MTEAVNPSKTLMRRPETRPSPKLQEGAVLKAVLDRYALEEAAQIAPKGFFKTQVFGR
jgi:hypothetical protein